MNKYLLKIDRLISLDCIYAKYYAIARTLLSLSTFVTIAFNDEQRLFNISFVPHPNVKAIDICHYSIFNLGYPDHLLAARIIASLLLVVVISGLLPRITCLLQWWLSFSLYASSYITEGGDQLNMILSFLIIPVCLFDNRINHWKKFKVTGTPGQQLTKKTTIAFSLVLIKLQIAVLYFVSGVSKIYNDQWREGTALYYWVGNDSIGFNKFFEPVFEALFGNRYILFFSTWGVIAFELIISLSVLTTFKKKLLLKLALLFHLLIFICFGLFSFELSMSAALFLYFLQTHQKEEKYG